MISYIKYPSCGTTKPRSVFTLSALLLVCALFVSCKKHSSHCYQCDMQNNGTYQDVGCYSDEDWQNHQITDIYGNNIDKTQKCRQK